MKDVLSTAHTNTHRKRLKHEHRACGTAVVIAGEDTDEERMEEKVTVLVVEAHKTNPLSIHSSRQVALPAI
jgi:hypothetical protein